jgi:CheY-like chemotaxis protein
MTNPSCQGGVLIVDDDPAIRESLSELITDEGYPVTTAANGREALVDLLRDGAVRPCLIVLDVMMPFMNGHELRDELKRHPELATIPIVVVSADPEARRLARSIGGDYLSKPIRFEVLLAAIERHCGSL